MRFPTQFWAAAAVCVCLLAARPSAAATIVVPEGGDLQAALNAAAPGDVITLAPGATYVGNFKLPNKPLTGYPDPYITIRSAAPDSLLPPAGMRITPAYAAQLPKIRSGNTSAALFTEAAAHHWKLLFLEFQANANGYNDIISLGAGDSTQTQLSQVPYALIVDRVYVHGDPVMGQKRGISLHSSDTSIVNSYISEIKTVGQDTQAISGYNGPGNYLIENNYLEAATENFMLGGSDPYIQNLVTSNVTFRRNYLTKPLAWRNPIIAPPANVSAVAAIGSGTLAAGTYAYKVVARTPAGQGNVAKSSASTEALATIPAGSVGGVTVSWTPVAGSTEYRVYGRTAGTENIYWTTTTPYFTDTGAAGTSGTPGSATKWSVKNIFELKNAQDVVVEGNVFENCWVADQNGFAIVFTPRNQSGGAPWAVVQRVMFRNNLVRHSAGGVNILGTDDEHPSQLTNNITIRGNIFDDLGSAWGSGSRTFQAGAGGNAIVFDHNTVDSTDSILLSLYGGTATAPTVQTNFSYMNNMSEHRTYGVYGDAIGSGLPAITAYLPGSIFVRNVLAGGSASKYPAENYFPTVAGWQADFVDFAGADYHLRPTSVYKGAATDGIDLGADVDVVSAHAAIALSGDNRSVAAASPVQITTTTLPNGMMNQAYAQTLACTGGLAPCAWQLVDASLPAGLSFDPSTAVLSGTPTTPQTGAMTVSAFDPSQPANSATATLTVTVDAPPFVVDIPVAPEGRVGTPYQLSPSASGAVGSVSWTIASGALPAGLSIDAFTGAIGGTPTAWGTSTAMVQAQDSWQPTRVDAKPLTITVAPSALQVTPAPLAPAVYQQFYQTTLRVSGGTGAQTWTLVSGALPAGIILNPSGTISGTPTAIGTFAFTVQATDANWPSNTSVASLSLVVDAPPFVASMPPAPAGQVGVAYQLAGSSSGQVGTAIWSIASGALPPGLVISSTGVISGAPTAPGSFSSVVQAQDSWNASRVVNIPVAIPVAPSGMVVATTALNPATVFRAYQATLTASGGSGQTTWSLASGSLPAGLTLTSAGVISGTPTTAGSSTFVVKATDSLWVGYTAMKSLTLSVTAREIVVYAADATVVRGEWRFTKDRTAAAGRRLTTTDLGAPKLLTPYESPASYFEVPFQAEAGVGYHLWVRGKAAFDSYANDSAFVQFSGAIDSAGTAVNRIGSTAALAVSIEDGGNAGLSGWGWSDDCYGCFGSTIYFAASGAQTIRVQLREDGLSIDQIVLSAGTYATRAPGATKNDTTIVPK